MKFPGFSSGKPDKGIAGSTILRGLTARGKRFSRNFVRYGKDQNSAYNPFWEQFVNKRTAHGILPLIRSLIRLDTDFSRQKFLYFGSDYRLEQIRFIPIIQTAFFTSY